MVVNQDNNSTHTYETEFDDEIMQVLKQWTNYSYHWGNDISKNHETIRELWDNYLDPTSKEKEGILTELRENCKELNDRGLRNLFGQRVNELLEKSWKHLLEFYQNEEHSEIPDFVKEWLDSLLLPKPMRFSGVLNDNNMSAKEFLTKHVKNFPSIGDFFPCNKDVNIINWHYFSVFCHQRHQNDAYGGPAEEIKYNIERKYLFLDPAEMENQLKEIIFFSYLVDNYISGKDHNLTRKDVDILVELHLNEEREKAYILKFNNDRLRRRIRLLDWKVDEDWVTPVAGKDYTNELTHRLERNHIVRIIGYGGLGKTALVTKWCHEYINGKHSFDTEEAYIVLPFSTKKDEYGGQKSKNPEKSFFYQYATFRDLYEQFLLFSGVKEGLSQVLTISEYLKENKIILILDNFEDIQEEIEKIKNEIKISISEEERKELEDKLKTAENNHEHFMELLDGIKSSYKGKIIITSRRDIPDIAGSAVDLQEFQPRQAQLLMQKRFNSTNHRIEELPSYGQEFFKQAPGTMNQQFESWLTGYEKKRRIQDPDYENYLQGNFGFALVIYRFTELLIDELKKSRLDQDISHIDTVLDLIFPLPSEQIKMSDTAKKMTQQIEDYFDWAARETVDMIKRDDQASKIIEIIFTKGPISIPRIGDELRKTDSSLQDKAVKDSIDTVIDIHPILLQQVFIKSNTIGYCIKPKARRLVEKAFALQSPAHTKKRLPLTESTKTIQNDAQILSKIDVSVRNGEDITAELKELKKIKFGTRRILSEADLTYILENFKTARNIFLQRNEKEYKGNEDFVDFISRVDRLWEVIANYAINNSPIDENPFRDKDFMMYSMDRFEEDTSTILWKKMENYLQDFSKEEAHESEFNKYTDENFWIRLGRTYHDKKKSQVEIELKPSTIYLILFANIQNSSLEIDGTLFYITEAISIIKNDPETEARERIQNLIERHYRPMLDIEKPSQFEIIEKIGNSGPVNIDLLLAQKDNERKNSLFEVKMAMRRGRRVLDEAEKEIDDGMAYFIHSRFGHGKIITAKRADYSTSSQNSGLDDSMGIDVQEIDQIKDELEELVYQIGNFELSRWYEVEARPYGDDYRDEILVIAAVGRSEEISLKRENDQYIADWEIVWEDSYKCSEIMPNWMKGNEWFNNSEQYINDINNVPAELVNPPSRSEKTDAYTKSRDNVEWKRNYLDDSDIDISPFKLYENIVFYLTKTVSKKGKHDDLSMREITSSIDDHFSDHIINLNHYRRFMDEDDSEEWVNSSANAGLSMFSELLVNINPEYLPSFHSLIDVPEHLRNFLRFRKELLKHRSMGKTAIERIEIKTQHQGHEQEKKDKHMWDCWKDFKSDKHEENKESEDELLRKFISSLE